MKYTGLPSSPGPDPNQGGMNRPSPQQGGIHSLFSTGTAGPDPNRGGIHRDPALDTALIRAEYTGSQPWTQGPSPGNKPTNPALTRAEYTGSQPWTQP